MILKVVLRVDLAASARGPWPRKMRSGLALGLDKLGVGLVGIGEEKGVIFDGGGIINRGEIAVVVHFEEGIFLVFDVVDEKDAV